MKIALFTDTYDEVNGVANTFQHLTRYCRKHDIPFDVYTHTVHRDSADEDGSVRIFRYKPALPIDIYSDLSFDIKLPRFRIFKDVRARHYDLVHTATPGSMGLHGLALALLDKIPLVSSYHTCLPEYVRDRVENVATRLQIPNENSDEVCEFTEDLTWGYMEWFYNQTRLVLAPSRPIKDVLEKRLKTRIDIFSRGIDTDKFHPRFRRETEGVTAIYVGRVSTEKNLHVLVDMFKGRSDVRLVVVGDGPYRSEMKEKLPEAEFAGFLKGRTLSEAYASADFFVFPSVTDTFGNVVLEAMSSGLPVIVTDKLGPKEIVQDGQTGFVAPDFGVFAKKVDFMIKNHEKRRKMGKNARQYALSCNWDSVFQTLFDTYKDVLYPVG